MKIAAGEVAGILDADALLQLSLGSVPGGGVAGDHEVTNVVDVDDRCSAQRLDQPPSGRTLACCGTSGETRRQRCPTVRMCSLRCFMAAIGFRSWEMV